MPAAELKKRVAELTPRLREILRLISLGCDVHEVAAILKLSPSTVDNHRSRLMSELGIHKSVLLARIAIKYGVSSVDDTLTSSEKRKSGRKKDGWS